MNLQGCEIVELLDTGEERPIVLAGSSFTFGCNLDSGYILTDNGALGTHAEIKYNPSGQLLIYNYSKEHPVIVNDVEVTDPQSLAKYSMIKILDQKFLWMGSDLGEMRSRSLPGLRAQSELQYNRFTVNNFNYCIEPDEEGNTSIESPDAPTADQSLQSTLNDTPKVQVINTSQTTEEPRSSEKKRKLLNKLKTTGIALTNYSPRETGVRCETSHMAVLPVGIFNSTPKKNAAPHLIDFSTPTTAKKTMQLSLRNTSMHLIDLTCTEGASTPKPKPNQLFKSAVLSAAKKTAEKHSSRIAPHCSTPRPTESRSRGPLFSTPISSAKKTDAIPHSNIAPQRSTPKPTNNRSRGPLFSTPSSADSVISVSSTTDSSSVVEISSAELAISTPKCTPSSLMKRAVLTSARKAVVATRQNTPTSNRLRFENSLKKSASKSKLAQRVGALDETPKSRSNANVTVGRASLALNYPTLSARGSPATTKSVVTENSDPRNESSNTAQSIVPKNKPERQEEEKENENANPIRRSVSVEPMPYSPSRITTRRLSLDGDLGILTPQKLAHTDIESIAEEETSDSDSQDLAQELEVEATSGAGTPGSPSNLISLKETEGVETLKIPIPKENPDESFGEEIRDEKEKSASDFNGNEDNDSYTEVPPSQAPEPEIDAGELQYEAKDENILTSTSVINIITETVEGLPEYENLERTDGCENLLDRSLEENVLISSDDESNNFEIPETQAMPVINRSEAADHEDFGAECEDVNLLGKDIDSIDLDDVNEVVLPTPIKSRGLGGERAQKFMSSKRGALSMPEGTSLKPPLIIEESLDTTEGETNTYLKGLKSQTVEIISENFAEHRIAKQLPESDKQGENMSSSETNSQESQVDIPKDIYSAINPLASAKRSEMNPSPEKPDESNNDKSKGNYSEAMSSVNSEIAADPQVETTDIDNPSTTMPIPEAAEESEVDISKNNQSEEMNSVNPENAGYPQVESSGIENLCVTTAFSEDAEESQVDISKDNGTATINPVDSENAEDSQVETVDIDNQSASMPVLEEDEEAPVDMPKNIQSEEMNSVNSEITGDPQVETTDVENLSVTIPVPKDAEESPIDMSKENQSEAINSVDSVHAVDLQAEAPGIDNLSVTVPFSEDGEESPVSILKDNQSEAINSVNSENAEDSQVETIHIDNQSASKSVLEDAEESEVDISKDNQLEAMNSVDSVNAGDLQAVTTDIDNSSASMSVLEDAEESQVDISKDNNSEEINSVNSEKVEDAQVERTDIDNPSASMSVLEEAEESQVDISKDNQAEEMNSANSGNVEDPQAVTTDIENPSASISVLEDAEESQVDISKDNHSEEINSVNSEKVEDSRVETTDIDNESASKSVLEDAEESQVDILKDNQSEEMNSANSGNVEDPQAVTTDIENPSASISVLEDAEESQVDISKDNHSEEINFVNSEKVEDSRVETTDIDNESASKSVLEDAEESQVDISKDNPSEEINSVNSEKVEDAQVETTDINNPSASISVLEDTEESQVDISKNNQAEEMNSANSENVEDPQAVTTDIDKSSASKSVLEDAEESQVDISKDNHSEEINSVNSEKVEDAQVETTDIDNPSASMSVLVDAEESQVDISKDNQAEEINSVNSEKVEYAQVETNDIDNPSASMSVLEDAEESQVDILKDNQSEEMNSANSGTVEDPQVETTDIDKSSASMSVLEDAEESQVDTLRGNQSEETTSVNSVNAGDPQAVIKDIDNSPATIPVLEDAEQSQVNISKDNHSEEMNSVNSFHADNPSTTMPTDIENSESHVEKQLARKNSEDSPVESPEGKDNSEVTPPEDFNNLQGHTAKLLETVCSKPDESGAAVTEQVENLENDDQPDTAGTKLDRSSNRDINDTDKYIASSGIHETNEKTQQTNEAQPRTPLRRRGRSESIEQREATVLTPTTRRRGRSASIEQEVKTPNPRHRGRLASADQCAQEKQITPARRRRRSSSVEQEEAHSAKTPGRVPKTPARRLCNELPELIEEVDEVRAEISQEPHAETLEKVAQHDCKEIRENNRQPEQTAFGKDVVASHAEANVSEKSQDAFAETPEKNTHSETMDHETVNISQRETPEATKEVALSPQNDEGYEVDTLEENNHSETKPFSASADASKVDIPKNNQSETMATADSENEEESPVEAIGSGYPSEILLSAENAEQSQDDMRRDNTSEVIRSVNTRDSVIETEEQLDVISAENDEKIPISEIGQESELETAGNESQLETILLGNEESHIEKQDNENQSETTDCKAEDDKELLDDMDKQPETVHSDADESKAVEAEKIESLNHEEVTDIASSKLGKSFTENKNYKEKAQEDAASQISSSELNETNEKKQLTEVAQQATPLRRRRRSASIDQADTPALTPTTRRRGRSASIEQEVNTPSTRLRGRLASADQGRSENITETQTTPVRRRRRSSSVEQEEIPPAKKSVRIPKTPARRLVSELPELLEEVDEGHAKIFDEKPTHEKDAQQKFLVPEEFKAALAETAEKSDLPELTPSENAIADTSDKDAQPEAKGPDKFQDALSETPETNAHSETMLHETSNASQTETLDTELGAIASEHAEECQVDKLDQVETITFSENNKESQVDLRKDNQSETTPSTDAEKAEESLVEIPERGNLKKTMLTVEHAEESQVDMRRGEESEVIPSANSQEYEVETAEQDNQRQVKTSENDEGSKRMLEAEDDKELHDDTAKQHKTPYSKPDKSNAAATAKVEISKTEEQSDTASSKPNQSCNEDIAVTADQSDSLAPGNGEEALFETPENYNAPQPMSLGKVAEPQAETGDKEIQPELQRADNSQGAISQTPEEDGIYPRSESPKGDCEALSETSENNNDLEATPIASAAEIHTEAPDTPQENGSSESMIAEISSAAQVDLEAKYSEMDEKCPLNTHEVKYTSETIPSSENNAESQVNMPEDDVQPADIQNKELHDKMPQEMQHVIVHSKPDESNADATEKVDNLKNDDQTDAAGLELNKSCNKDESQIENAQGSEASKNGSSAKKIKKKQPKQAQLLTPLRRRGRSASLDQAKTPVLTPTTRRRGRSVSTERELNTPGTRLRGRLASVEQGQMEAKTTPARRRTRSSPVEQEEVHSAKRPSRVPKTPARRLCNELPELLEEVGEVRAEISQEPPAKTFDEHAQQKVVVSENIDVALLEIVKNDSRPGAIPSGNAIDKDAQSESNESDKSQGEASRAHEKDEDTIKDAQSVSPIPVNCDEALSATPKNDDHQKSTSLGNAFESPAETSDSDTTREAKSIDKSQDIFSETPDEDSPANSIERDAQSESLASGNFNEALFEASENDKQPEPTSLRIYVESHAEPLEKDATTDAKAVDKSQDVFSESLEEAEDCCRDIAVKDSPSESLVPGNSESSGNDRQPESSPLVKSQTETFPQTREEDEDNGTDTAVKDSHTDSLAPWNCEEPLSEIVENDILPESTPVGTTVELFAETSKKHDNVVDKSHDASPQTPQKNKEYSPDTEILTQTPEKDKDYSLDTAATAKDVPSGSPVESQKKMIDRDATTDAEAVDKSQDVLSETPEEYKDCGPDPSVKDAQSETLAPGNCDEGLSVPSENDTLPESKPLQTSVEPLTPTPDTDATADSKIIDKSQDALPQTPENINDNTLAVKTTPSEPLSQTPDNDMLPKSKPSGTAVESLTETPSKDAMPDSKIIAKSQDAPPQTPEKHQYDSPDALSQTPEKVNDNSLGTAVKDAQSESLASGNGEEPISQTPANDILPESTPSGTAVDSLTETSSKDTTSDSKIIDNSQDALPQTPEKDKEDGHNQLPQTPVKDNDYSLDTAVKDAHSESLASTNFEEPPTESLESDVLPESLPLGAAVSTLTETPDEDATPGAKVLDKSQDVKEDEDDGPNNAVKDAQSESLASGKCEEPLSETLEKDFVPESTPLGTSVESIAVTPYKDVQPEANDSEQSQFALSKTPDDDKNDPPDATETASENSKEEPSIVQTSGESNTETHGDCAKAEAKASDNSKDTLFETPETKAVVKSADNSIQPLAVLEVASKEPASEQMSETDRAQGTPKKSELREDSPSLHGKAADVGQIKRESDPSERKRDAIPLEEVNQDVVVSADSANITESTNSVKTGRGWRTKKPKKDHVATSTPLPARRKRQASTDERATPAEIPQIKRRAGRRGKTAIDETDTNSKYTTDSEVDGQSQSEIEDIAEPPEVCHEDHSGAEKRSKAARGRKVKATTDQGALNSEGPREPQREEPPNKKAFTTKLVDNFEDNVARGRKRRSLAEEGEQPLASSTQVGKELDPAEQSDSAIPSKRIRKIINYREDDDATQAVASKRGVRRPQKVQSSVAKSSQTAQDVLEAAKDDSKTIKVAPKRIRKPRKIPDQSEEIKSKTTNDAELEKVDVSKRGGRRARTAQKEKPAAMQSDHDAEETEEPGISTSRRAPCASETDNDDTTTSKVPRKRGSPTRTLTEQSEEPKAEASYDVQTAKNEVPKRGGRNAGTDGIEKAAEDKNEESRITEVASKRGRKPKNIPSRAEATNDDAQAAESQGPKRGARTARRDQSEELSTLKPNHNEGETDVARNTPIQNDQATSAQMQITKGVPPKRGRKARMEQKADPAPVHPVRKEREHSEANSNRSQSVAEAENVDLKKTAVAPRRGRKARNALVQNKQETSELNRSHDEAQTTKSEAPKRGRKVPMEQKAEPALEQPVHDEGETDVARNTPLQNERATSTEKQTTKTEAPKRGRKGRMEQKAEPAPVQPIHDEGSSDVARNTPIQNEQATTAETQTTKTEAPKRGRKGRMEQKAEPAPVQPIHDEGSSDVARNTPIQNEQATTAETQTTKTEAPKRGRKGRMEQKAEPAPVQPIHDEGSSDVARNTPIQNEQATTAETQTTKTEAPKRGRKGRMEQKAEPAPVQPIHDEGSSDVARNTPIQNEQATTAETQTTKTEAPKRGRKGRMEQKAEPAPVQPIHDEGSSDVARNTPIQNEQATTAETQTTKTEAPKRGRKGRMEQKTEPAPVEPVREERATSEANSNRSQSVVEADNEDLKKTAVAPRRGRKARNAPVQNEQTTSETNSSHEETQATKSEAPKRGRMEQKAEPAAVDSHEGTQSTKNEVSKRGSRKQPTDRKDESNAPPPAKRGRKLQNIMETSDTEPSSSAAVQKVRFKESTPTTLLNEPDTAPRRATRKRRT